MIIRDCNILLTIKRLIFQLQGKASLDIANLRGDTPLKMLQANTGSIWIGQKVMERIRDESQAIQRRNFLLKLTLDKVKLIFD